MGLSPSPFSRPFSLNTSAWMFSPALRIVAGKSCRIGDQRGWDERIGGEAIVYGFAPVGKGVQELRQQARPRSTGNAPGRLVWRSARRSSGGLATSQDGRGLSPTELRAVSRSDG